MSIADEFWSAQSRVSYFWLEQQLDADDTFAREALDILRHVNPVSTHSTASSANELLNCWTVQRELTVYDRGKPVADITDVYLYADANGKFETALNAVEQDLLIDRAEFLALLMRYGMSVPAFLSPALPSSDKNEAKPLENWKMRIQAEAAIRWRKLRKVGCNPTKHSLKDDLAGWCRTEAIMTNTGINPTAEYIYRHVLRQWTPPKDD